MDYVSLYLNSVFASKNPQTILSLLFLTLARLFPIIAQAPFFGAKVLPHPVKVVFGLSLFAIFLPELLVVTTTPMEFGTKMIFYLAKELFIGFAIGFIAGIPFLIAQNVGVIVDHQRGGASLMVNDPIIQSQSSPLGTLFNLVLIFIFFSINGPFFFIDAIAKSYQIIPPDQFINPLFFAKDAPFWGLQIELLNKVMVISIQLAAPALIAMLMTDFFLGIANRLAPQVQISFLGMPLKSLLGLLVICLGWKIFTSQMSKETASWMKMLQEMVQGFVPGSG